MGSLLLAFITSPVIMQYLVCIALCLAVILSFVQSAPFNAEGGFYNGDAGSAPSFDIKEHLWPGLTVKSFSLGGRRINMDLNLHEISRKTQRRYIIWRIFK